MFVSCEKSNSEESVDPTTAEYLILSEGNYGSGNASLSTVSFEGSLVNNVFQTVNGLPLGDVGQSITYIDGKYYVVLNSARKIQVFGADDYALLETISMPDDNSYNPLYMEAISSTQAVVTGSDFYVDNTGCLTVINTASDTVVKTVMVEQNCYAVKLVNGKLYVNAPSVYDWYVDGNGYWYSVLRLSGKVLVYNIDDLSTTPKTIEVAMNSASAFQVDKDGMIWFLNSDDSQIVSIDPTTDTVVKTIDLAAQYMYLSYNSEAVIDAAGENLYFTYTGYDENWNASNEVYSFNIASETLSKAFSISDVQTIYNVKMSPKDEIVICDALDYAQSGYVYFYTTSGTKSKEYVVGVNPNDVLFTENN